MLQLGKFSEFDGENAALISLHWLQVPERISPSNWQLWRIDPSTAPLRPTYSRVHPCFDMTSRRRLQSSTGGGGAEIARPDNPAPCRLRWFRLPSVLRFDVEENDWTVRESVPTSTTAGAAIRTVCDCGLWGGVSGGIFPR